MPDATAETCARALITCWVQRYGVPVSLVSDRGPQFTSALWDELMTMLGVVHKNATAYHPQANGMVERFHRQLKSALKAKLVGDAWAAAVPLIMLGIRTAVKEDLGASAAEMVFGSTLRLPGEYFGGDGGAVADPPGYLRELRDAVRNKVFIKPDWHGRSDSGKSSYVHPDMATCEMVYELVSSVKTPLQRPYKGPFRVLERHAKHFLIDRDGTGKGDSVSLDRLKPAYTDTDVIGSLGDRLPHTRTRAGRPVVAPDRLQVGRVEYDDDSDDEDGLTAEAFMDLTMAHAHNPVLDPAMFADGDDEVYTGRYLDLGEEAAAVPLIKLGICSPKTTAT